MHSSFRQPRRNDDVSSGALRVWVCDLLRRSHWSVALRDGDVQADLRPFVIVKSDGRAMWRVSGSRWPRVED